MHPNRGGSGMSSVVANEILLGKCPCIAWMCLGEIGGQMQRLPRGLLLVIFGGKGSGGMSSFGGMPTKCSSPAPRSAEKNEK